jgi:endonuclease YncB( thermonuclease family)
MIRIEIMSNSVRLVAYAGRHRSSGRSRHTGGPQILAGGRRAAALLAVLALLGPAVGTLQPRLVSDGGPLYWDEATNSEYDGPSRETSTYDESTGTVYRGVFYATGTVTAVADGDTIRVSGVEDRVRILGIDTPETVAPGEPVQCWGPEASQFARDTLLGRTVDLHTDPTQATQDSFGRLLAYAVLPDGTNYSIAAAAAGVAKEEVFNNNPVRIADQISAAVQAAQQARLGRWGPPCNEEPEAVSAAASPEPATAEPATAGSVATAPDAASDPTSITGSGSADPRFETCEAAIAQGFGPYTAGVDVEYGWYIDRDSDGIVCET